MVRPDFQTHLARTFALPLLLISLLAGMLFWLGGRETAAVERVDRNDQVIAAGQRVMRHVLDMQSGLRGYLLTGNDSMLAQYRRAQAEIGATLDTLQALVSGNPSQQRRVQRLRANYEQWEQWAQRMIATRTEGGDYQSLDALAPGLELMAAIRQVRSRIVHEEETLRNARVAEARRDGFLFLGAGIVLVLLLAAVLTLVTWRRMKSIAAEYEQALATAHQRTAEREQTSRRLDAVLGSMAEGLYQLDIEGRLVYINPAGEKLLGYSTPEILGRNMHEVVHSCTPEGYGRSWEECPLMGVIKRGTAHHAAEDHLLRKDGSFLPVEITSSPIVLNGQVSGVVVTFRDLTERKRSELALRNSERLASAGRLAASIAHEINNPIDVVVNLLYLLGKQPLDAHSRHYVQSAQDEIQRVVQITQQMLSLHREAKAPVPIDLPDLLDDLLTLYEHKLQAHCIQVEKRYDLAEPVRVFPGEMRQVFSNLVSNAIDAVHAGGKIKLHVFPSRQWNQRRRSGVRVVVADNGSGIPNEARHNIFEPFFTTKAEKGTGLGLWVSSGIVQKHDGFIRMRSSTRPGRSGTCFTVFLPR